MKRFINIVLLFAAFLVIISATGTESASFKTNDIQKIILTEKEVPEGFMYGKIPQFARNVLKGNPWMMDEKAIRKLAGKIYPGGDARKISGMHVSIMASRNRPYGDDIVCYVILYRDQSAAKEELEKMNKYAGFNRDRAILLTKDNLAVFMFVDDVDKYHFIKSISESMESRLKSL